MASQAMFGSMASPVPTRELGRFLQEQGISYERRAAIGLGFGAGKPQYRLMEYPLPGPDCVMGIFFEWHTRDFFDWPDGPHLAVGLRGPVEDDPHRGRGLAIGILAGDMPDAEHPEERTSLFDGCPPWPGGPSYFIEDFSINEGVSPIEAWQMTRGMSLPELANDGVYRIDIQVSRRNTRARIWQVVEGGATYLPIGQADCHDGGPGSWAGTTGPCPELLEDRGIGNAFIGTGFASPDTRSVADSIYLAHWKDAG